MQDGEEITITYTARIDPSKASDGTITADQTRNTVTVQKEDGEPHTAEYSHSIELVNLDKSNGVDSGVEVDGQKLYSWTIDYNPMALVSVAGHTIKDTISETSQTYMTYYGDVTVKVLNSSGTQIRSDTFIPGSTSWNYVLPNTGGPGTRLFMILGSIMIAGAGLLLWRNLSFRALQSID